MARGGAKADDADVLAVRPHRSYHLPARILAGLVASTVVLLLASIQGL